MKVQPPGLVRLLEWLAGNLGPLLVRCLGRTLRIRRLGFENVVEARRVVGNVIYASWHGRLLILSYLHRNQGINVLVSDHQDGEYIARVIHGLGFGTSRGSSTRGGAKGIKGLMDAGVRRHDLAITPDGPRGPRERCQAGVIYLAKRTGLPVVPVGASHCPSLVMRSWDRFMVPLPFARCAVVYGEPIVYGASLSDETIREAQLDLERRLKEVTREADGGCGRNSG